MLVMHDKPLPKENAMHVRIKHYLDDERTQVVGPLGLVSADNPHRWHDRFAQPGEVGEAVGNTEGDPLPFEVPDGWILVRMSDGLFCPVHPSYVEDVTLVEVRVSGFVYYECFDPGCTEFPREHPEIGEPVSVKIGKGRQFRYSVPRDVAETMLDHAEIFGEAISFGVDDPSAGRKVLAWVRRERDRLGLT